MVSAVGSSAFTGATGAAASATGLEAQYARLQRQLADWECCSSAKTPEGKAKIKEISEKVRVIETRLAEANDDKPFRQSTSGNTNSISIASLSYVHSVGKSTPRLLDVYA